MIAFHPVSPEKKNGQPKKTPEKSEKAPRNVKMKNQETKKHAQKQLVG